MFRFIVFCILFCSFHISTFAQDQKNLSYHLRDIFSLSSRIQMQRDQDILKNLHQDALRNIATYSYLSSLWKYIPTKDRTRTYHFSTQKYKLSCELSALQVVLQSLGIKKTEDEIFASIPKYNAPYSGGIWGDPDYEFVGYLTGGQTRLTGFGVYPFPMAQYGKSLGLEMNIPEIGEGTGSTKPHQALLSLLEMLDIPNVHTIFWGDWCTDPNFEDGILETGGHGILKYFPLAAKNECTRIDKERTLTWNTPTGKQITALSGEHAFILLGYIGDISSPSHIIVWDTYTGRHIYPYTEWMRKWGMLEYRTLIISQ